MVPRLYIDAPLAVGAVLTLGPAHSHYVRDVLRRSPGEALGVFNAGAGEFAASIVRADRKAVEVKLGSRLRAPASEGDLWLLFAPVKKDAVDFIVGKGAELGVAEFHPVMTERTVATRINVERLQATAIEAAEQCGRLSIPKVEPARRLFDLLADWPAGRALLYCDEAGDDPAAPWGGERKLAAPVLTALRDAKAGSWAVLIGPEGGFSRSERTRLRALPFVVAASLGPRILRADTAATAALALWQAALGDLGRGGLTEG